MAGNIYRKYLSKTVGVGRWRYTQLSLSDCTPNLGHGCRLVELRHEPHGLKTQKSRPDRSSWSIGWVGRAVGLVCSLEKRVGGSPKADSEPESVRRRRHNNRSCVFQCHNNSSKDRLTCNEWITGFITSSRSIFARECVGSVVIDRRIEFIDQKWI